MSGWGGNIGGNRNLPVPSVPPLGMVDPWKPGLGRIGGKFSQGNIARTGGDPALVNLIQEKRTPLDYGELLKDQQVLFLGENHSNQDIRYHLATKAAELRAAGVTHYAIEAPPDEGFQKLNQGFPVDLTTLDVGPGGEDYRMVIRAMHRQGIAVVPVDIDQSTHPPKDVREAYMADRLAEIVETRPDAKVAYLVGAFHTQRGESREMGESAAQRTLNRGITAVCANYIGGSTPGPRMLSDAVFTAGCSQETFALNLRKEFGDDTPLFGGRIDIALHLPE